jgi:hypothetical protein
MIRQPLTSRTTSIIGTYHQASPDDIAQGLNWYPSAHRIALNLSGPFACGVITSAGVLAALSPNNKWERNVLDAQRLLNTFKTDGAYTASQIKVSTFDNNKAKALAILKLQSPTVNDVATVLNGLKISAFYRCILGDSQTVCVDGHAYSIWIGHHITTTQTPKISPRLYEQISADYRAAARIVSTTSQPVTPAELQAITWLTHKRINAR